VAGSILLILSMIAFHKLEATFGGQALMVLGLLFWIAELFIASKGILGIAGTLSFIIGSFLLFDVEAVGYDVPTAMILTTALTFGGLSFALTYLATQSLNQKPHDHDLQMKKQKIKLMSVASDGLSGQAELLGEIWNFESDDQLKLSDEVEFIERNHLKIKLRKKT
jgi:membrane-bound serine protease (ClpP class)